MLGRTLKMAFWVTYDHAGKLILASVVWFVAFAVPGAVAWTALASGHPGMRLILGWPMLVLSAGIILPVLTAGAAHMAKILIERHDGSILDLFRGIRLYGRRAAGIGLLYFFAIASLTTSAWFYASMLRDTAPWLAYGLSAAAVWALAFVGLTALLVMPALVQKKGGVLATIRLGALLVLANPLFAAGLAVQALAFTVLAVIVSPMLPLLYGGVVVVLVSSAYEMLARKYAAATPDAAPPPKDEEDDYLNRGFRDFLFPWKG